MAEERRGRTATTAAWRMGGLALGVAASALVLQTGALGRGELLAAPVFALGVLAGVLPGEVTVEAPSHGRREASLTQRRILDYMPRTLGLVVALDLLLLVALLVATSLSGSAADLGRPGRSLARSCGDGTGWAGGPWPGTYYTLPLAALVAVGVAGTAITLRLVCRRPRVGNVETDTATRRASAAVVVAGCGILVAIPLAGIALTAAAQLHDAPCGPGWWPATALALLVTALAQLVLLAACARKLLPRPNLGS